MNNLHRIVAALIQAGRHQLAREVVGAPKPKRGDLVDSPFAGEPLRTGGTAPKYGVIKTVSRGYAYVDYKSGSALTQEPLEDMQPAGKAAGRTVWRTY